MMLRTIDKIRKTRPGVYSRLQQELNEFYRIIRNGEDIPLIIKNEKIISGVGRPDIEVFGGRILIEVKVKPSEFPTGFQQLSRYVKFYPKAEYAVLTNYNDWLFYRVEKGVLRDMDLALDEVLEEVLSRGARLPLSTENIGDMFSPLILVENELHEIFYAYKVREGALFGAYRNIMRRLYERASQEEIESLFIKHTLMQMIVSSCLTLSSKKRANPRRACSGEEIGAEIVLPYLKWWEHLILRGCLKRPDDEFLNSILESVYSRTLLFDWDSGSKEDVFRELYEIMIDEKVRREMGEYYTPLWLVEYMTEKMSEDVCGLRGKTVLDPFCGSGTFLVSAFYKKIEEGEDPDEAITEIIGFDINPLAVSIARAELTIAYQSVKEGTRTPLVFNTDSASLLLRMQGGSGATSFLKELREIEKSIGYVSSPVFPSNSIDFSEILKIEPVLRHIFRDAAQAVDIKQELGARLDELKNVGWKGHLTSLIVNTLANGKNVEAVAGLIEKYGNGVWAVSVTSLFAPHIIRKVKVDLVITNPPWAQLTEPKGSYGDLLRGEAKKILGDYEKTGQILSGSDISSILLHGCINIGRREVVFLMPSEAVYTADSYHGLGKILTYSVVKNFDGEIFQIGFDAFQHGRLPCILTVRKEDGEFKCHKLDVKWDGSYSKALRLSEVKCTAQQMGSYGEYMENVIMYTEISSETVKKRLGVEDVIPKGDHIMGLFGGEKKKGAKRYAGLKFDVVAEDRTTAQYSIKLSRTEVPVRIPYHFLNPYWKKLVYRGKVFPFYLDGAYNVLLSSKGREDLKKFLCGRLLKEVSGEDKDKIEGLIDEFVQPDGLKTLEEDKYYVIYRRMRTFASSVISKEVLYEISDNRRYGVVISDTCSYISVKSKAKAYYYSSILNYLAYKVIQKEGAFERDQFLRPLITILLSDLEWRDESWQVRVAELGEQIQLEAPHCFQGFVRRGIQVNKCFERLKICKGTKEPFEEIIKIVDRCVDEKKLEEALKFVCKLKNVE